MAFARSPKKEMFLLLTGVNGVGPKLAVGILSGISPDELRQVVILQDYLRLKNIPGVGKKIADRVMLELRDKVQGKTKEKTARPSLSWKPEMPLRTPFRPW